MFSGRSYQAGSRAKVFTFARFLVCYYIFAFLHRFIGLSHLSIDTAIKEENAVADFDDYIDGNVQRSATSSLIDDDPTLVIVLISNNRYDPLFRLCTSLLEADYSDSKGYFSGGINLVFNLESKSSKKLVDFAVGFQWPYGSKTVRMRLIQGGLVRAVSESWYPSSMSEYGSF